MIVFRNFVLVLLGVAVAAVTGRFTYRHFREAGRLRAHVQGANSMRMSGLHSWLELAAAGEPMAFLQSVSNGLSVDATALPLAILTNFPSGTANEDLRDTFGHPFHLKLTARPDLSTPSRARYTLLIWSDGPNGVNEQGKGDDMDQGESIIECAR